MVTQWSLKRQYIALGAERTKQANLCMNDIQIWERARINLDRILNTNVIIVAVRSLSKMITFHPAIELIGASLEPCWEKGRPLLA